MPDMTGRPGCRTTEMFGSTAPYLARTPRIPVFVLIFVGLGAKNVLDYQGRAGSTSIVQWTLRPVMCGVEKNPARLGSPRLDVDRLQSMVAARGTNRSLIGSYRAATAVRCRGGIRGNEPGI